MPENHDLTVEAWTHGQLALVCSCHGWSFVAVFDGGRASLMDISQAALVHMQNEQVPMPARREGQPSDL